MRICRPHENGRAAFSDFSTLRLVLKKVRFQVLSFQDPCGPSAKTVQYMRVFAKECFRLDGPTVSSSTLRHCADQLSPVFTDIFNTSLETCYVPACWPSVPVPPKAAFFLLHFSFILVKEHPVRKRMLSSRRRCHTT